MFTSLLRMTWVPMSMTWVGTHFIYMGTHVSVEYVRELNQMLTACAKQRIATTREYTHHVGGYGVCLTPIWGYIPHMDTHVKRGSGISKIICGLPSCSQLNTKNTSQLIAPAGGATQLWGNISRNKPNTQAKIRPHVLEDFRYMGSLPMYGKTSQLWEDFPHMGSLPIYGKTSHVWEDFPHMGNLPMYGKTSLVWCYIYIPNILGMALIQVKGESTRARRAKPAGKNKLHQKTKSVHRRRHDNLCKYASH
jgi:hypothetical protein